MRYGRPTLATAGFLVLAGSRRTLIWRVVAQRLLNATSSSSINGNSSGSSWRQEKYQPASPLLPAVVYRYRAVCDTDFHGPGCTEFCRPRNDSFGHYDCHLATGRKLCHTRWTGTFCHTRAYATSPFIYLCLHRSWGIIAIIMPIAFCYTTVPLEATLRFLLLCLLVIHVDLLFVARKPKKTQKNHYWFQRSPGQARVNGMPIFS